MRQRLVRRTLKFQIDADFKRGRVGNQGERQSESVYHPADALLHSGNTEIHKMADDGFADAILIHSASLPGSPRTLSSNRKPPHLRHTNW
jgi:hypothetical protein